MTASNIRGAEAFSPAGPLATSSAPPQPQEDHSTSAFRLSDGVFFCITQGHGIFLDLNRDSYDAVLLAGAGGLAFKDLEAALQPHADTLRRAGLLARDGEAGRPLATTAPSMVWGHILGLDDRRAFGLSAADAKPLAISPRDVGRFLLACVRASRDLKRRPIKHIVARAGARKRAISLRDTRVSAASTRRIVAMFARLRPFYPRDYLCLFDSLALLYFLADYGAAADWVFAVQAQPFGAHCWLEQDHLLLNESSEYAGQFTPIMII